MVARRDSRQYVWHRKWKLGTEGQCLNRKPPSSHWLFYILIDKPNCNSDQLNIPLSMLTTRRWTDITPSVAVMPHWRLQYGVKQVELPTNDCSQQHLANPCGEHVFQPWSTSLIQSSFRLADKATELKEHPRNITIKSVRSAWDRDHIRHVVFNVI